MSRRPISLSADLTQLQDEGYDIDVRAGHLVLRQVPYVDAERQVKRGTLVSSLELTADVTQPPQDHVVRFAGEAPCDANGNQLTAIYNGANHQDLGEDVVVDHIFSSKPIEGSYRDYHHKMTTYEDLLSRHARQIEPEVTAKVFPVIPDDEDDSVFHYVDTASSRAGIAAMSEKLKLGPVAIVGLGGTGSYVLDLIAKTPIQEIHLYDGDRFSQHNAFRSPGAPTIAQLEEKPQKVDHMARQYSGMHRNVVPHAYFVDASNLDELDAMSFVFLALDNGPAKKVIVDHLEDSGRSFIDVGMGIQATDDALLGTVRVSTSTPEQRERARASIPFAETDAGNEYSRNIQIADLNAINAALAVIRWKKLVGFYADLSDDYNSLYLTIDNYLINEGAK
jgi:ThiF family